MEEHGDCLIFFWGGGLHSLQDSEFMLIRRVFRHEFVNGFFPLHYRKQYEESMMVRLNMPKHAKNSKKRGMMSMSGQLSGITHFGDITALTGGEAGQVSGFQQMCFFSQMYQRGIDCVCRSGR